jgi:hypothetical protein
MENFCVAITFQQFFGLFHPIPVASPGQNCFDLARANDSPPVAPARLGGKELIWTIWAVRQPFTSGCALLVFLISF